MSAVEGWLQGNAGTAERRKKNASRVQRSAGVSGSQGCQILLGAAHQNGENIPNMTTNIPNRNKIYQMTVKWANRK
jgi:hypothetical protein